MRRMMKIKDSEKMEKQKRKRSMIGESKRRK